MGSTGSTCLCIICLTVSFLCKNFNLSISRTRLSPATVQKTCVSGRSMKSLELCSNKKQPPRYKNISFVHSGQIWTPIGSGRNNHSSHIKCRNCRLLQSYRKSIGPKSKPNQWSYRTWKKNNFSWNMSQTSNLDILLLLSRHPQSIHSSEKKKHKQTNNRVFSKDLRPCFVQPLSPAAWPRHHSFSLLHGSAVGPTKRHPANPWEDFVYHKR